VFGETPLIEIPVEFGGFGEICVITAVYFCPTVSVTPVKSKSRKPNNPIGAVAVLVATVAPEVPDPFRRVS
jgi:hypothetical protein